MIRSEEAVRIIAELRKTPSPGDGYYLRGQLPDGREVQVFANQRKLHRDDADFLLVVAIPDEGENR